MQNSQGKFVGYKKVGFNKENQNSFYYFIVAEKKDVEINENSLAFKIDSEEQSMAIIKEISFSGNFDYILCEVDKISCVEKYFPCLAEDVQF